MGQADPLSSETRVTYATIKTNLLKMAERMPAENYTFRPTPDIETFGRRVAHIADANFRTCAGLKGEQKSLGAAKKTSKEDLVAALKDSFAYCDPVFEAMTDNLASHLENGRIGSPPLPAGEMRTRLSTLFTILRHSNEMYGYMSVYLRLKGVFPPSTEP
jgi:uncharacterized damage-inducible protein DinB